MKAIVTGADGFVGSALVFDLLKNGYDVLAIDLPVTPRRLPLSNPHLKYVSKSVEDISFLSSICDTGEYLFFYHYAWRGSAGPERCDEKIQLTNALQSAACLREAAKIGCKRFIFSGSLTEFETNQVVYEQGSSPSLPYIYGAGKTAAHEICKPIANGLGIDLLWAHITNCYGVGESSPRLLNTTLRKIIQKEKLEFTAAEQLYDFVYVSDVAEAFRLIGEKGQKNKSYIIGSGQVRSLRTYLEMAIHAVSPNYPASFGALTYTGAFTPASCFDITEVKKDCGFQPNVGFEEGVRMTYEWLKGAKN